MFHTVLNKNYVIAYYALTSLSRCIGVLVVQNICLFYLMFQKRLNAYLFKHLFPSNFRNASVNFFPLFSSSTLLSWPTDVYVIKFRTKLRFWVRCISYFDFVFNLEDCYPQFTHMH